MATTTFDHAHGGVRHHGKLGAVVHDITVTIAVACVGLAAIVIVGWLVSLHALGRVDPAPRHSAPSAEVWTLQA